jgi:hypothetical protein
MQHAERDLTAPQQKFAVFPKMPIAFDLAQG